MSGVVSETDSDDHITVSPAMSDRSVVNESMHIETPPSVQPSGESSLINLPLSSFFLLLVSLLLKLFLH